MLEVYDYDDRGDGPAKAAVAKTTRARQLRRAKETQQELYRIKERVTRTLDAYDLGEKLTAVNDPEVQKLANEYIHQQATLEFVDDLMQLMVILSDPLAKRKYQQQVTVFIVGFENLCGRREKLLVQLQEFFNQTGKEDVEVEPLEFDFEVISHEVKDALDKAQETTSRLLGMSKDVVKAIKMANPKEAKKGKKKLEKALQQSQQDILSLTEKLLKVQNELDENENKLNQVYKSVEVKQIEIDRLKIQAENGKKRAEQVEQLKAKLLMKEDQLSQSNKQISELELSVAHLEDKRGRDLEIQKRVRDENEKTKDLYEGNLREQQQHVEDIRLELQEKYDAKVKKLTSQHREEILILENKYKLERNRGTRELEITKKKFEESSHSPNKSSASLSFSPDSKFVSCDPSVFSPDSSEGEISSGRASLKSSAKQIRMMLAKKSESSFTSSSCSRTAKTASPPDKAATVSTPRKPSQGSAGRDKPQSRQSSKLQSAKEKSQDKQDIAEAVVTKMDECVETERVELVDVAVQSESEECTDPKQKPDSRTSSNVAETVTESKTEQIEHQKSTDGNAIPEEILMEKFKEFEEKAMDIQEKLESKLMKWKNKYHAETRALQEELAEMAILRQMDKETVDKQLLEAIQAKELAEQDAVNALLQLEELLGEREEREITDGKVVNSQQQPESRESTSRHSVTSHQSSERHISEASLHGDSFGIARDSGVDVGSSAVNDSRPLSRTSHVNVLSPSLEVDESPPSMPSVPPQSLVPDAKPQPLEAAKRGISARAKARLINAALNEHPFVIEIFRIYDAFTKFRTGVIQWLEGQGMTNEVGSLENIKTLQLNKDGKAEVLESLPKIRGNVTATLERIGTILLNKKFRKPFNTKESLDQLSGFGAVNIVSSQRPVGKQFPKKEAVRSNAGIEGSSSYVKLLKDYNDLAESYEQIRQHMDEEAKFNQEQTSQNAAIMAEMQESINQLKAQLAEARSRRSASSERTNSIIMFSRLDAERNSKILKRAASEDRVSQDNLSDVMIHMESYVSLPTKRLAYISRRYQHHCAMKQIEENLKKSTSLDKNVFGVLDRMEELQNQRARRWGDKMDDLSAERERLAHLLTDTFDMIEQDTGIFLIKPVLSYKGRGNDVGGYVVSKHKSPTTRPVADNRAPTTPAPSPWLRRASKSSLARATSSIPPVTELDNDAIPVDVSKAAVASQGYVYQGHTWQVGKSQVQSTPPITASSSAAVTTSRLQEIDVNRMIIGHNLISSNVGTAEIKADVLGASTRSYMAIERPFGAKQVKKSKRPVTTGNLESPPNTPYDVKTPYGQSSGPLPPIRLPLLRNESRSSKSLRSYSESEFALVSVADGSPVMGDFRPGTQETATSKDSCLPLTSESSGPTAAR